MVGKGRERCAVAAENKGVFATSLVTSVWGQGGKGKGN